MRTERWVPKNQGFEAVRISMENIKEAAIWCGGEVSKRTQPTTIDEAYDTVLRIPGLAGAVEATIGHYLIKLPDGKFTSMSPVEIEKDFKKVARRQDGVAFRGDANFAGQMESMGH